MAFQPLFERFAPEGAVEEVDSSVEEERLEEEEAHLLDGEHRTFIVRRRPLPGEVAIWADEPQLSPFVGADLFVEEIGDLRGVFQRREGEGVSPLISTEEQEDERFLSLVADVEAIICGDEPVDGGEESFTEGLFLPERGIELDEEEVDGVVVETVYRRLSLTLYESGDLNCTRPAEAACKNIYAIL